MIEKKLSATSKAFVIEIMDIFYEIPRPHESMDTVSEKEEKDAHMRVVKNILKKAKKQGYTNWLYLNYEKAKAKGNDLGIRGMGLVVVRQ